MITRKAAGKARRALASGSRAATLHRARPAKSPVAANSPAIARGAPAAAATDAETIATRITDAIVEHRLLPGTRLGEESLGEIFGVSRTKVREALFIVARYKLITWEPSKSACVAQPSVQEARDVFETRRVLEAATARRLAGHAGPAQLRLLHQQIEREAKLVQSGDVKSGTAYGARVFGDFHRLIAELAGNAVLAAFVREISARTSLVEVYYGTTMPGACSHDEHVEVLAAIERGDADAAALLMIGHFEHIEKSVMLRDSAPGVVDLREALRA